jgi:hypothetical protein
MAARITPIKNKIDIFAEDNLRSVPGHGHSRADNRIKLPHYGVFTAVLPAAVNHRLWIATSSRFFMSCGKAPMIGCNKSTARRTALLSIAPPPPNLLAASWKQIGNSLGKFFFGFGCCFAGAGFGAGA